jgi:hypothetical protein
MDARVFLVKGLRSLVQIMLEFRILRREGEREGGREGGSVAFKFNHWTRIKKERKGVREGVRE